MTQSAHSGAERGVVQRLETLLRQLLEHLLTVTFMAIFALVVVLVVMRYLFNTTIVGGNEVTVMLFIFTTALGAAVDVARGKHIWETRNCVGCHTILGEGAYFAPELGNVYTRRGPEFIKAWIKAQPTGAPGRRQMPQFHLSDQELDDLVAFLKYTNGINTNNWPPNVEG